MIPLRAKVIKAMQVRGFSVRTHESYLYAVTDLARYFHRAPDQLGIDDLRRYFEHLATERALSGATCRLFLNGIRFLYLQVLGWSSFDVDIPIPKKAQRIPELLTRAAVGRILAACPNPKHRMMLTLCFGCGLRLGEVVSLKVRDIDGERQLLRVEQGKGAKDRLVPLSDTLLAQLRAYWRLFRPRDWLSPHQWQVCHHSATAAPRRSAGFSWIATSAVGSSPIISPAAIATARGDHRSRVLRAFRGLPLSPLPAGPATGHCCPGAKTL